VSVFRILLTLPIYLPSLITAIDEEINTLGLWYGTIMINCVFLINDRDEAITIRMTGCPNGCARPYIAEIGLVGKAPGIYNLYPYHFFSLSGFISFIMSTYIGGGFAGQRLNKLFKEAANEKEILEALRALLQQYAKEKLPSEHFGDFVIRANIIKPVLISNTFHD